VLSASAEGTGEPFWWETDQNKKAYSISSDKIVLGSLGPLGNDGNLYRALHNEEAFDVTPTVEGNPYYTYTKPGVSKHRLVHQTQCAALTDSNLERRSLGVGEYVNFSFDPPFQMTSPEQPLWGTSEGSVCPDIGSCTTFTAPSNATASVVHVSVREAQLDTTFAILEPSGVTGKKQYDWPVPPGKLGVGMHLNVVMEPSYVAFSRIKIREIGGPATNVTGFFTNFPALYHQPNTNWSALSCDNSFTDDAGFVPDPCPPWSAGSCEFRIPIEWTLDGSQIGSLTNVIQRLEVLGSDGTAEVTKFSQSARRTP